MGVTGATDSIPSNMFLDVEQNVTMKAGRRGTSPTHVLRFKMMNSLDMVQVQSFKNISFSDVLARHMKVGGNSSVSNKRTCMCHFNNA